MSKRQLSAFLLRFSASIAASLLVRLAAVYPIMGWAIGAVSLLLAVKLGALVFKLIMYRVQQNSPHFHLNHYSDAAYGGGDQITLRELTEESIAFGVWATAILLGGLAAWYALAMT